MLLRADVDPAAVRRTDGPGCATRRAPPGGEPITSCTVAVVLALLSSLLWGSADFLGGTLSRRIPAVLVVLASQTAGLALAVLIAAITGAFGAPLGYLPWAVVSGLVGAGGLLLFYRALAIGTMGVVSPIAALGVVVPVAIALTTGRLPSAMVLVGLVVAIIGVLAVSGPERSSAAGALTVLMGLGAAVGFGLALYAIARGSQYSPVMTMVAMRVTSVTVLAVVAALSQRRTGIRGLASPRQWLLVAAAGVLDVSANLAFAYATRHGALAIVAVLGSLYPAATVLLARLVHGERLGRLQQAGVLAALVGVALISAGS